jgi:hypothetical protein
MRQIRIDEIDGEYRMMRTLTCRLNGNRCLGWAAALILIATPARGNGFDEHYIAHYGDANGDGLMDIYLKWEPEVTFIPFDDLSIPVPLSRRDVPNTLLMQTASGGFVVDTSAALTFQWPKLPAPAVVAVIDFNMDGYMDIGLRYLSSLSTIFPQSVRDQIVYAPEVRGQRPSIVKIIDPATLKFFKELYGWITNAQYFRQNAPQIPASPGRYVTYLGYILEPYPPYHAAVCVFYDTCEYRFGNVDDPYADPNDIDAKQNVWHWWGIMNVTGSSRPDYSVFDRRAMDAASLLQNVVLGNETITPGSDLEGALEILIGDVLDVIVYGGVFDEGTPDYVDNEGLVIDEYRALIKLAAELFTVPGGSTLNFFNPLANAYINKRDGCTADGRFGMVRNGGTKGHWGVDLGTSPLTPVDIGTPVYAVWDGTAVEFKEANKKDKTKLDGYGVQTRLYIPGYPHYFIYAHLSTAVTGRIFRASIAGYVGRTGNITCEKTHLHFEVKDNIDWSKRIDPASESAVFQWSVEP